MVSNSRIYPEKLFWSRGASPGAFADNVIRKNFLVTFVIECPVSHIVRTPRIRVPSPQEPHEK